ncbi:MAG: hypothetical protein EBV16_06575, partial [Betaproteobacteria bacterium]|nr:hypothetical protein [Betaproteobacteria bacterium]
MLVTVGILLTFALGLALWVSGNARLPVELKNSLGPDQLEAIPEGTGSMMDHTVIVYLSDSA